MDSKQKEVQQAHLDEEKRVIRKLKQMYKQASKDCEEKIQALASRTDMENLQSIIYQKQYQQALKTQIDGILDTLQTNEFDSVAEYLTACYENGYVGTMYTLHGQGIPVITPIDQAQVVNAVQTESKLSENLYARLGEDTAKLKKSIRGELSRGIANGSSWLEVAKSIASGMNSPFKKAMNNAIRIARTEGGRIISQANLDAAYKARENGADSVKQWNATLDGRTRPDHRAADGQIRELDEYFTVGGEKMKAPCIGGSARNVCNCRCCMDMIPRWALDEGELQRLKDRAAYFGLDKTEAFEEFREKYLQAVEMTRRKIGEQGQEIIDKATYNKLTRKFVKNGGVIIRGEEAKRHLESVGAYASYITGADAAFIRNDATVSDVLSRGIANGSSWLEVAKSIASGMNSPFKKAMNNAIRIARTEGGRIISQANLDAAYKARENGADSVKQWNATLDGRTRPDHRAADGQIRELDEYFTVGGEKMKAPCIGGSARNVCNCRCCMDMIPRWALDEGELQRLKDRAAYFGLDKTEAFEEFREKYLQAVEMTRRKIGEQGQEIIDKAT
ncbi:MAG: phage head morphogenesis protein [Clostridiales bacterium]|nr:phage head morphogenesis protein [Clostridiales bacterium]